MFRDSSGQRGQTSVDFAMAMGVFLVAFVTVVAFLPQITEPFTRFGAEDPLVADRLASQLADYQLAAEGRPGVLNATCTAYFFKTSGSDPCPSFDSSASLEDKLGVDDTVFVNVTVRQDTDGDGTREILCADDASSGNITDPPCSGSEYSLALGDDPPDDVASVTSARRAVLLDGRQEALLEVRVWS